MRKVLLSTTEKQFYVRKSSCKIFRITLKAKRILRGLCSEYEHAFEYEEQL